MVSRRGTALCSIEQLTQSAFVWLFQLYASSSEQERVLCLETAPIVVAPVKC